MFFGSVVNELVDKVIYNNLNDSEERKIEIKIYPLTGDMIYISKNEAISKEVVGIAPGSKKYKIVVNIDSYTGNVDEVEIHEM